MSPRVLPLAPASRATVALAALALAGCAAAERTVAPPADSPRALVVSPALLAAVGDAELRLLPSVDAALRPALGGALAELHAALDAGQLMRTRRALAAVRSLVAAAAPTVADAASAADTDAADLAAVAMLVAAAEHEVTPTAAARVE